MRCVSQSSTTLQAENRSVALGSWRPSVPGAFPPFGQDAPLAARERDATSHAPRQLRPGSVELEAVIVRIQEIAVVAAHDVSFDGVEFSDGRGKGRFAKWVRNQ